MRRSLQKLSVLRLKKISRYSFLSATRLISCETSRRLFKFVRGIVSHICCCILTGQMEKSDEEGESLTGEPSICVGTGSQYKLV